MKSDRLISAAAAVFVLFSGSVRAGDNLAVLYSPEISSQTQSEEDIIVSPKFIADEDLNFDNLDLDALEAEDSDAPAERTDDSPQAAEDDSLPVLPKDSSDILPSQNRQSLSPDMPPPPVAGQTPLPQKGESLTESLQQAKETAGDGQNAAEDMPMSGDSASGSSAPKDETWLSKLKSPLKNLSGELLKAGSSGNSSSLEDLMDDSRGGSGRSNASVFNISGVMLRMSLAQVDEIMKKNGFTRVYQKFDIPNFIRWRNEDSCRNNGVVGYERLESCVVQMAKKDNHQYVSLSRYSKFATQEEITVRLTSNFTNNKVYKIIYKSMASTIRGNSPKAVYLRNIKIYDFWRRINRKYGAPDDKENVIWSLGPNKPYLQASTGFLVLEDPMLRELDYTRMSREDQRFMNTDLYSF